VNRGFFDRGQAENDVSGQTGRVPQKRRGAEQRGENVAKIVRDTRHCRVATRGISFVFRPLKYWGTHAPLQKNIDRPADLL
jgi:hypothetical protein